MRQRFFLSVRLPRLFNSPASFSFFFFLHPGSQARAGMPPCPRFYLSLLLGYKRLRFARAGKIVVVQALFRACLCASLFTGCRGLWYVKDVKLFHCPARPRKRTCGNYWGTRLGLRKRPDRANAHCLRPTGPDEVGEAEFARASGRGLRRVNNFAQDATGMCKKR